MTQNNPYLKKVEGKLKKAQHINIRNYKKSVFSLLFIPIFDGLQDPRVWGGRGNFLVPLLPFKGLRSKRSRVLR